MSMLMAMTFAFHAYELILSWRPEAQGLKFYATIFARQSPKKVFSFGLLVFFALVRQCYQSMHVIQVEAKEEDSS
jgi:hypothetical protein